VKRVRLLHWHAAEAEERALRLRAAGLDVRSDRASGQPLARALRADPPDAIVIDLSRIPSQGRDVALLLRTQKATRGVPLVFVGGERARVDEVRRLLPDATYTSWARIRRDLARAIARPAADPVVPRSVFDAYAGRSLVTKLGIKPGARVALVGAPQGFRATLGALPEGASLHARASAACELTLWFARSRRELERDLARRTPRDAGAKLWILWPKRTSALARDLSQPVVRAAGLAAGLVDYKITSVDETWSGLLFTRRKPARR
jgi:hypothetical protein